MSQGHQPFGEHEHPVTGQEITLDLHGEAGYRSEVLYTRLRAPYVNPDGFRFNIYHETVFSGIAHLFGGQDVTTGFDEFDHMFVVKATDEDKVRRLCAGKKLRELVKTEPHLHLFVRNSGDWFADRFPEGVDELVLEVEGEVTDLDRLKRLYAIFAQTLHRLCRIGSAYEDDPHVELEP